MDFSIIRKSFGPYELRYDWRTVALYALSCGAGQDDLQLVLEPSPSVLPTFADVASYRPMFETVLALKADLLMRLHLAVKTKLHRPFPSEGVLFTTSTVRDIYDQGATALLVCDLECTESGTPLFSSEWHVAYRGYGKFGGARAPDPEPLDPPPRDPDARFEVSTPSTAGHLFRLVSDDLNPIHADPSVSRKLGFPKTILHGICTFGHAARAATRALASDPGRVRAVEARFTKPVVPGDTIVTDVWRSGAGEGRFIARVKERNDQVLSAGRLIYES
jgi:3-hydroxyacyl-CoA dehydrogenase/3a,7a,12a-trihydroxy-5b-cholest-24-enoyl-CoA hydratase